MGNHTELTALVIDDEDLMRKLLTDYLSDIGVRTESVATTALGLDLVTQNNYDLVFTDLNQTPSGVELYQAAIERGMKAYIMTGGASPEIIGEAKRIAGKNLILKPFNLRDIESIVDGLKAQKGLTQS